MLPINAYVCHDLLLLLCLWWLFNFRATWEVIIQARPQAKRKGKRSSSPSSDPQPFPGLTKKPVCQACTQEQNPPKEALEPPPLMVSERGRPAEIDNSRQFCPHQACRYYSSCLRPKQQEQQIMTNVSVDWQHSFPGSKLNSNATNSSIIPNYPQAGGTGPLTWGSWPIAGGRSVGCQTGQVETL